MGRDHLGRHDDDEQQPKHVVEAQNDVLDYLISLLRKDTVAQLVILRTYEVPILGTDEKPAPPARFIMQIANLINQVLLPDLMSMTALGARGEKLDPSMITRAELIDLLVTFKGARAR